MKIETAIVLDNVLRRISQFQHEAVLGGFDTLEPTSVFQADDTLEIAQKANSNFCCNPQFHQLAVRGFNRVL